MLVWPFRYYFILHIQPLPQIVRIHKIENKKGPYL